MHLSGFITIIHNAILRRLKRLLLAPPGAYFWRLRKRIYFFSSYFLALLASLAVHFLNIYSQTNFFQCLTHLRLYLGLVLPVF